MKRILTFLVLLTFAFAAYSQQSLCPTTVTTPDGNTYTTIWVGGNCWMKENLRSTSYGTQSNVEGVTPTYMVYPNIPSSMGYLYSWYTAVGIPEGSNAIPPKAISERVQGICPNEWMIPTAGQLELLYNSGDPRINENSYWVYSSTMPPAGTSGFNMLPAGYYNAQTQNFYEYKLAGYLWALNYNGTTASCGIFPFDCRLNSNMTMNKYNMLSVRCVKAPPYGVEEVTACDSYTWNGETFTETGRYVGNFPNDSVSTLLLTVNYTTYGTLDIIACDSYYWDLTEQTYTVSGTHTATIENYLGCDSIVTLNLEVRYSNTGIDVQDHCDSYEWIDGITYTESTNTPTFVVTNSNGCDSTVTLNLTIRKMTTGIDVQNHCDAYTWIDGETYTESTNEPTYTLVNAAGCDSVVTLNLTIRNKTYGIDVQDHCDSYTWINDVTYTESTDSPVFTITNEAGCDSIVTLNLTIRNSTSSPSVSLTEYNTYTWNEQTYTTSGVYTATLTNAVGCDSTATLDLTILYRFPITYNINGGAMPAEYPVTYIQGVGATLPIPTKLNNRFDGWYDNAAFTGSPITTISNVESGNKQFWALWTVTSANLNSFLTFSGAPVSNAQISNTSTLNPTTALTLEAWIYPTIFTYSNAWGTIISNEQSTGSAGYVLTCGSSSRTLRFAIGNGSSLTELTTSSILVLNEWQHVAATFDGSTMKIFRNGVEVGTKTLSGSIAVSSNPVEIGRSPRYNERYFHGNIDEVRIWNTALTQPLLQSWYNKSVNNTHTNYANLVGYYEFDNFSNNAQIIATVGENGTLNNSSYRIGCNSNFTSSSNIEYQPTKINAIHPNTGAVNMGEQNVQIMKIEIETIISSSLTEITFTTTGTTTVSDLLNAKLYFTGSSNTFATTTTFGNIVVNPNGTFTFSGNQPLSCGLNNFWLTYDISASATVNNFVDATLTNATVERLTVSPLNGNPSGNRKIINGCPHLLKMRDTASDSWNNGNVSLFINGNTVYNNISVTESSSNWYDYPFAAQPGDTIRVVVTSPGQYPSEMRVQILSENTVLLSEVQPVVSPGQFVIAGCFNIISASTGSNGTISPSGSVSVGKNGTQKFTFVPATNCWLDSLIVDGINRPDSIPGKSYTFTNVNEPHTIRAVYDANIITATAAANGSISPSGATIKAPNSSQIYTITPSTNYFLDSLIVDGINRPDSIPGKRFTFTNVNEDHTIRVVFRTNTITSSTGPNGTISPLGGTNKLPASSQKYTITPNQYYFLDSLLVNGINVPDSIPGKSYTFNNINSNNTIRVVFKTNFVTPTLITPPTVVGSPAQGNALSTLTFTDGLVEYNSIPVPGTFAWTTPATLLETPGNYSVTFSPTDTNSYFKITFNVNVTFNISYLLLANGTTTNTSIPINGLWTDAVHLNQMVYPESMLTHLVGRQISSLVFYFSSPPSAPWTCIGTFKIGTTSVGDLALGIQPTPPNTVFVGLMPTVGSGTTATLTITFSSPFTYTGGNLLIEFSNTIGVFKAATFYGITQTSASRHTRGTTNTLISFLPKTRFNILP